MVDPNNAKGHVVFDCDGTLVSSYEGVIQALTTFLSQLLEREVQDSEVRAKYYPQIEVMAERFGFNAEGKKDYLLQEWARVCSLQPHKFSLFPEIKNLLNSCEKENWALYVWTGRDRATTLEILNALGIMPYFWDLRTASDGIPKPHPMGLEELVGEHQKQNIVLIGDSSTDHQGATNFGCHFIGATWCEHAERGLLEKSKYAQKPLECLPIIKSLFD